MAYKSYLALLPIRKHHIWRSTNLCWKYFVGLRSGHNLTNENLKYKLQLLNFKFANRLQEKNWIEHWNLATQNKTGKIIQAQNFFCLWKRSSKSAATNFSEAIYCLLFFKSERWNMIWSQIVSKHFLLSGSIRCKLNIRWHL